MMKGWDDKQQYIRARLSPGQYITEEEEEKIILQQVNICMSFTMKMLPVSLLVVAMMALISGAEAQAANSTEPPPTEKEVEPESTLDKEAEEPEGGSDEEEDETDSTAEGKHEIDKRATYCPCGWSLCRGRCFRYFPGARTWAVAQRHCQNMGGNLASVHNRQEENWMKRLARYRATWIGLSDAEQERYWFWSNGAPITYWNFCRGQPDNAGRRQNCVQFNWSGRRCWDDDNCLQRKGYICVRR